MMQKKTQEKNSDLEVLNIIYFYKLFLKEKKSYAPSLFVVNKKTRLKRKRQPTYKEFCKIVYEFLKIYFFELYFEKQSIYFFLGGFMKTVTYQPFVENKKRGLKKEIEMHASEKPIGFFWYQRPSRKMHYMVKLHKLTGSSNQLPKIERLFKANGNKDLLPIFTEEQRKGRINKTLYRCIQR